MRGTRTTWVLAGLLSMGLIVFVGSRLRTNGEADGGGTLEESPSLAEPEEGEALTRSVVFVAPSSLEELIYGLIASREHGLECCTTLKQRVAEGVLSEDELCQALLVRLRRDAEFSQPLLCHVDLCAGILLAHFSPNEDVQQAMRAYRELEVGGVGHERHRELRDLLLHWPPSHDSEEAIARQLERLRSLESGFPSDLEKALRELLASGSFEDREAARRAILEWIERGASASQFLQMAIDSVIAVRGPWQATTDLLALAEEAQAPGEANASTGISVMGSTLALRFRAGADSEETRRLIDAFASQQTGAKSRGGALLACMALGGAADGDLRAIQALDRYWRFADDRTVRNTALVNLGNVADLDSLNKLGGPNVKSSLDRLEDGLDTLDYFAALHNVLTRHPEDRSAAAPLFERVLTTWKDLPESSLLLPSIFSTLRQMPIPELEPLLRELAAQTDAPWSEGARAALDALDER